MTFQKKFSNPSHPITNRCRCGKIIEITLISFHLPPLPSHLEKTLNMSCSIKRTYVRKNEHLLKIIPENTAFFGQGTCSDLLRI